VTSPLCQHDVSEFVTWEIPHVEFVHGSVVDTQQTRIANSCPSGDDGGFKTADNRCRVRTIEDGDRVRTLTSLRCRTIKLEGTEIHFEWSQKLRPSTHIDGAGRLEYGRKTFVRIVGCQRCALDLCPALLSESEKRRQCPAAALPSTVIAYRTPVRF